MSGRPGSLDIVYENHLQYTSLELCSATVVIRRARPRQQSLSHFSEHNIIAHNSKKVKPPIEEITTTMSSTDSLPIGFSFTKTIHRTPYPEISPSRPELSHAEKTVLITGGHTGIGYAIARAFAQASAERIIIVGRRADLVTSAASRLKAQFPKVQTLGRVCDVSDLGSADALWEELAKDDIVVDVVVLNAAKLSTEPILEVGRDAVWSEYLLNVRTNLHFAERLYKQPNAKGRRRVGTHETNEKGRQLPY